MKKIYVIHRYSVLFEDWSYTGKAFSSYGIAAQHLMGLGLSYYANLGCWRKPNAKYGARYYIREWKVDD